MNKLKDLVKYSLDEKYPEYGLFPDLKGNWVTLDDVKHLLKEIGYLTDLNLKNDSHRHNMVFKGVNITYRLSVKKSHFWIYNRDTGQEKQHINIENGIIKPYERWNDWLIEFWNEILKDMM